VFNNKGGAIFDAQADNNVVSFSTATFNNSGLFKRTTGTFVFGWQNVTLNNAGTIDANSSPISIDARTAPFNKSGTLNAATGTFIQLSSGNLNAGSVWSGGGLFLPTYTVYIAAGVNISPASVRMVGATLTGSGTLTTMNLDWQGGTMTGTGTTVIPSGGTALLRCDDSPCVLDMGWRFSNSGTVTWTSGNTVNMTNGATFNNLASGVFDVQNASNPQNILGTFANAGLFEKTISGAVPTRFAGSAGPIVNLGTIDAQVGAIQFGGGLTNSGTLRTATGSTIDFNGGIIALNTGSSLTGAGNFQTETAVIDNAPVSPTNFSVNGGSLTVRATFSVTNFIQTGGAAMLTLSGGEVRNSMPLLINGGSVRGAGTITGDVSLSSGATVAPGTSTSTGAIAISGDYTQAAGGNLNIALGGASAGQYDQLNVSGHVSLAGTLNGTYINGFTASGGQTFTVLTFSSRSGDFSTYNLPPVSGGMMTSAYTPTSLVLTAGAPSADLAITKTLNGSMIAGQNAVYTLKVTNNGPSIASAVAVSDVTPAGLTFVSNSGGCVTVFPCSIDTLAPGQIVTITSTYSVAQSASGEVTNTATVSSSTADPNLTDNSASFSTSIVAVPTITFTASPSTINPGETSTLSWTTSNATTVSISGINGTQPANGSISVTPTATTTYTLTATGPGGTATASTTIVVDVNAAAPVIMSFAASPSRINSGQTSTLSWATSNATTVSISGVRGAQPANGSVSVTPTATTSYTLTAVGAGGSVTASLTVIVSADCIPPRITQPPQDQTVLLGGSATLSVTANGSSVVSYTWFLGPSGDRSHPVGLGPSFETGAIVNTTFFWVRASNTCGVDDSATVVVSVCDPPKITRQPQSTTVLAGQQATISVEASGSSASFTWFEGQKGDTSTLVGTGQIFQSAPIMRTTSFWVRVSNECGVDDSSAASVNVLNRHRAVGH
jgi:uncharacterized repeat protein (TIGR01451 family)